jgi:hypothetical protein
VHGINRLGRCKPRCFPGANVTNDLKSEADGSARTLTLRIFVSSPGDVPAERDRAAGVVARLQDEFVHYAVLEPFFWEDEPARATETFQSQFPEASGMDIVVGILWARIGTPLPMDKARPDGRRYESGTVYELETAAVNESVSE